MYITIHNYIAGIQSVRHLRFPIQHTITVLTHHYSSVGHYFVLTMNFKILLPFFVYLIFHRQTEAKVYTKCGLTSELLQQGFSRSFIGNWVCLIESESSKNTSKVINKANGSKGLGLFQISSKDWCTFQRPGGKCNIKCEDLINENISDDASCAKKVQGQLGFQGWDGWKRSCYGRKLPIPNC